jgi:hypothetical protein
MSQLLTMVDEYNMPRKGKGVRRILREERRLQEKKKQGSKYRRIRQRTLKKVSKDRDND